MLEKIVVCIFLAALILTGCGMNYLISTPTVDDSSWFYKIEDTPLVYDKDTRIVYYLFSSKSNRRGYGYMAPYYNEHGQMCYYVDGQIIPIEEALIDAD